jgi:hypothetical protein
MISPWSRRSELYATDAVVREQQLAIGTRLKPVQAPLGVVHGISIVRERK